jgi:ATP-dependent Clp protease ATP-binding subunit ClpB
MDLERYTQKSQEAPGRPTAGTGAQPPGDRAGSPAAGLLRQDEGVVPALITRVAGSANALRDELTTELEGRPKVYGAGGEVGLSRPVSRCPGSRRALRQGNAG